MYNDYILGSCVDECGGEPTNQQINESMNK
jgi:hypothetical protein